MAYITQTISTDRRIQLQNETLVRRIPWGTDWTYVRFGVRCSIYPIGSYSSNILYATPIMGFALGPYGWHTRNQTTDYIGWSLFNTSSDPWAGGSLPTITGSPPYYNWATTGWFNYAEGVYNAGGNNASYQGISATPATVRSFLSFEVQKSTYGVQLQRTTIYQAYAMPSSIANMQTDCDFSSFIANMARPNSSLLNAAIIAQTASYAGSAPWDHVFISWPCVYPAFEISDMAITRIK